MAQITDEQRARYAGEYFADLVSRSVLASVFAARFGLGRRQLHPFTREPLRWRPPPESVKLNRVIRARGLLSDLEFMAALAASIQESCRAATTELLVDWSDRQKHGGGGPDFHLTLPSGSEPDMSVLLAGFEGARFHRAGQATAVVKKARLGWPVNEHGLSACACCGYHTICDGPCTYERCPVCAWTDELDLDDAWNTSKWGELEDPWGDVEDVDLEDEEPWQRVTLEEARASLTALETLDYSDPEVAGVVRKPLQEELPRYDWSRDSRPF